jgi:PAS domain S-box-containing protein
MRHGNKEQAWGRAARFKTRLRRKNGTYFGVEVNAAPYRDVSGEIVRTGGTNRGLTERVRAERAFEESYQRFKAAFRNAVVGMALVATDPRWLQVHGALCEIVGYPEKELLGKRFQDITYPDDLDVDPDVARTMLSGEIDTYQQEKRYLHKQGRLVWGLQSVSLTRNEEGEQATSSSRSRTLPRVRAPNSALARRKRGTEPWSSRYRR